MNTITLFIPSSLLPKLRKNGTIYQENVKVKWRDTTGTSGGMFYYFSTGRVYNEHLCAIVSSIVIHIRRFRRWSRWG
jgi:hypothetical protein